MTERDRLELLDRILAVRLAEGGLEMTAAAVLDLCDRIAKDSFSMGRIAGEAFASRVPCPRRADDCPCDWHQGFRSGRDRDVPNSRCPHEGPVDRPCWTCDLAACPEHVRTHVALLKAEVERLREIEYMYKSVSR